MENSGPGSDKLTLLSDSGLLATMIETVHAGIALLDPQGRFVYVNQAYCEIQGFAPRELLGQRYTMRINFDEAQSHLQDVYDAVFHGLNVRPHEVQVHRTDGRSIWTEVACRLITHHDHRYCLITVQDITERKRLEEGLQSLATTDPLTGVANRRHFFEMARMEMHRVQRSKNPPAILMIDLDNFKDLNDTHGHAAGDRILMRFAHECQASLRESDIFGRLGGEEFAVLLPETTLSRAGQIAERLRQACAASRESDSETPTVDDSGPRAVSCTASIGVARVLATETSVEPAIHRADLALYSAKAAGRNRISVNR